jgi:predicted phosphodiesterase
MLNLNHLIIQISCQSKERKDSNFKLINALLKNKNSKFAVLILNSKKRPEESDMFHKRNRKIIVLFLILILSFLTNSAGQCPRFHRPNSGVIVFLSDTQSPMWIESLFLQRNKNDQAREMIFKDIIKQNPRAVCHLGDLVARGYSSRQWSVIDSFSSKLQFLNIPFYPIPGNHEYFLFAAKGIANFQQRFPSANLTGYSIKINTLAIILLNSNFSRMSDTEINTQQSWYQLTLNGYSLDTTITSIIVGCHHSPYTNSRIVSPDENVQSMFLPSFIKNDKCKVFISGHAHTFEHFRQDNKDFIVCGGGGALQHPLLIGDKRRWPDMYSNSSIRMFHYLLITADEKVTQISLQLLNEDFSGFEPDYIITIPD